MRTQYDLFTIGLLFAVVFHATTAFGDTDPDRGQALYDNHCGGCHDIDIHQRDDRRVNSRAELYGWVAGWSTHMALDWRHEEIESVTSYLSRRLYAFTR